MSTNFVFSLCPYLIFPINFTADYRQNLHLQFRKKEDNSN